MFNVHRARLKTSRLPGPAWRSVGTTWFISSNCHRPFGMPDESPTVPTNPQRARRIRLTPTGSDEPGGPDGFDAHHARPPGVVPSMSTRGEEGGRGGLRGASGVSSRPGSLSAVKEGREEGWLVEGGGGHQMWLVYNRIWGEMRCLVPA